jgi:hypothetical protein
MSRGICKRTRYGVDENNRLLINRAGQTEKLVADGEFLVESGNLLAYKLKEPRVWRREVNLPDKIRFVGNWSIDSNHNLEFILNQTKHQHKGDILRLNGEILNVQADAIFFEVATRTKSGRQLRRVLKLGGRWQADQDNHLVFFVKRKQAKDDVLTLQGAWKLRKDNLLVYRYEKVSLKTKKKRKRSILFKGFWEISSKDRLVYILDLTRRSFFSFKVQLQTPNLVGKKGAIKYKVGIGIRGKRPVLMRSISLFGRWRFGPKAGVSFEIDYAGGRTRAIVFGTDFYLTQRNKIALELKNTSGKDLGMTLTLSRKFLRGSAETFLRFRKKTASSVVDTGVKIPW